MPHQVTFVSITMSSGAHPGCGGGPGGASAEKWDLSLGATYTLQYLGVT
jgi:hypothetical protein